MHYKNRSTTKLIKFTFFITFCEDVAKILVPHFFPFLIKAAQCAWAQSLTPPIVADDNTPTSTPLHPGQFSAAASVASHWTGGHAYVTPSPLSSTESGEEVSSCVRNPSLTYICNHPETRELAVDSMSMPSCVL
jgi:hypothetical protein